MNENDFVQNHSWFMCFANLTSSDLGNHINRFVHQEQIGLYVFLRKTNKPGYHNLFFDNKTNNSFSPAGGPLTLSQYNMHWR
jgi:hypothetical protein